VRRWRRGRWAAAINGVRVRRRFRCGGGGKGKWKGRGGGEAAGKCAPDGAARGSRGGGTAAREAGGRAGKKGGAVLEVEDALTCGPHTSAGQREREGRRAERAAWAESRCGPR
jgi:hypothetical protein